MTELYVKIVNELSARRERAQTMAEYAVVLALITVAIVAAITFLGSQIKAAITSVANTI
jgi:Flp pilus assembly pilin Flp